ARPTSSRPTPTPGPRLRGPRATRVPELPELDVLAENLAGRLGGGRGGGGRGAGGAGARVVRVAPLKPSDPPIDSLAGLAVTGAGRRAKYVWLELGKLRLGMHLALGRRPVPGSTPAS